MFVFWPRASLQANFMPKCSIDWQDFVDSVNFGSWSAKRIQRFNVSISACAGEVKILISQWTHVSSRQSSLLVAHYFGELQVGTVWEQVERLELPFESQKSIWCSFLAAISSSWSMCTDHLNFQTNCFLCCNINNSFI